MFFVLGQDRKDRIAICKACPVYNVITGSCGPFLHPLRNPNAEPVTIDGVTFKPCGCNIAAKASLKISACPAGKWSSLIPDKTRKRIKHFLDIYQLEKHLTVEQRKELIAELQSIDPTYRSTNCPACVRNELKGLIDAFNFGEYVDVILDDLAISTSELEPEPLSTVTPVENELPPSIAKFVENAPKKRAKRKPNK